MEQDNSKLKFFILQKKYFIKLIEKLNYIIDIYDSLLEIDRFTDQSQYYMIHIDSHIKEKNDILNRVHICNLNIHKYCKHQFVEDMVDIDTNTSRYIKYCTICEYTETI